MQVFNAAKLVQAIKTTSGEIKAVKAPLRERWESGMGHLQNELRRLKARATGLCMLRAHSRGRVHIKGMKPEDQHDLVSFLIPEYLMEVPAADATPVAGVGARGVDAPAQTVVSPGILARLVDAVLGRGAVRG